MVYWSLHIDVSVLSYDRSPLCSCLLAVCVALKTATLPLAILTTEISEDNVQESSTSLATTAFNDLTLSPNDIRITQNFSLKVEEHRRMPLKCVSDGLPVACTFLILGPDDLDSGNFMFWS